MEQNIPNNSENVLHNFKIPKIFYPFLFLIIILIIFTFLIMYNVNLTTKSGSLSESDQSKAANTFIILFFVLLVGGFCILLLPNFKDLKIFFSQVSNVSFLLLYTIGLIIFFRTIPSDTLNKYAYIITPITILFAVFMFYKSFASNYIDKFNINYERIKMVIMFFCLITLTIVYYNVDPGGYISKNFGYSMLITILISVFAFLYLVVLLTMGNTTSDSKPFNFLNNFSSFSVYGSIGFILFLILITILILNYKGGFFNDKTTSAAVMILVLIISILWSTLLFSNLFGEDFDNFSSSNKVNLFKKALLTLFGLIGSSLLIFWIVYNIQSFSGQSSIPSLLLNITLVIVVLGLIYKTIHVNLPTGNAKKNAFFDTIVNLLFYIPCLFTGLFDTIMAIGISEYKSNTTGTFFMLLFAILLFVIYFSVPNLFNIVNLQGGKLLVNQPVYTDTLYSLGTYEQLNGSDKFDYQYAISFWVYLDASPPNTNSSYATYTSLLNFGNKPNVLYNGSKNSLMVTMQQKDAIKNKDSEYDEHDNLILYKNDIVLLQKWNNIIINYGGGILDIFLNGELVKSDTGIVPYYTLDNLTIGENNGIHGEICNIVYFKKALTSSNIFYLYNMVKNKTPPVTNDSNTTITEKNFANLGSSIKTTVKL